MQYTFWICYTFCDSGLPEITNDKKETEEDDMEGFKTFTQVMDMASDACSVWKSAEDGTVLSYEEMMEMAAYLDGAFPIVGHSWYVVFPDGEIGLLNEDEQTIIRMFFPVPSAPVAVKLGMEDSVSERPAFCMYCGAKLKPEANFCPKCGKRV